MANNFAVEDPGSLSTDAKRKLLSQLVVGGIKTHISVLYQFFSRNDLRMGQFLIIGHYILERQNHHNNICNTI